jgi:hypothetical protein
VPDPPAVTLSSGAYMQDYAFYHAGIDGPRRGVKRIIVPIRRLLRRIMRPMLYRQAELMQSLAERVDENSNQMQTALALGWDHVAMVRRLAAIEEQLIALRRENAAGRDDSDQLILPVPDSTTEWRRANAG